MPAGPQRVAAHRRQAAHRPGCCRRKAVGVGERRPKAPTRSCDMTTPAAARRQRRDRWAVAAGRRRAPPRSARRRTAGRRAGAARPPRSAPAAAPAGASGAAAPDRHAARRGRFERAQGTELRDPGSYILPSYPRAAGTRWLLGAIGAVSYFVEVLRVHGNERFHLSGVSSSAKIASTGQAGTQAPQSMHSSGWM